MKSTLFGFTLYSSSLDMLSRITVVKKFAEMSVKNDASGGVED